MTSRMPKDDLLSTWLFVEKSIDVVMAERQAIDMRMWINTYDAIHDFCTTQIRSNHSSFNRTGTALRGEGLYVRLADYLSAHLAQVRQAAVGHTEKGLLTFYIREWNRYTTAAKYNDHLFHYLNRHWVKREVDEGKKDVYHVYTLHLMKWRDDFFKPVRRDVMSAVLHLVEKHRNGEMLEEGIEQSQIRAIVNSFVLLGLNEFDPSKPTLEVYQRYFAEPFIADTKLYYEGESRRFLAENSVVEYMKKAQSRLNEEENRIDLYLHDDIRYNLMDACYDVLIGDHSDLLRDEFQSLLEAEREEDLTRTYDLLSHIPDGLTPLRAKFEAHVRKAGVTAVDKISAAGGAVEPKMYINALLDVYTRFQAMANSAFRGEPEFVRSLDNACREFVNRNALCTTSSTRSPELLAKYTDQLLKKSTKSTEDAELENALQQIMTIFRYIEDKDVFQKFYSRMLAKRLVNTTSISEDAETSMISKLKETCGFEYTNKLQRMFQDIQVSKGLTSNYKDWLAEGKKSGVDTNFQVLGTGFWPLSPPKTAFVAPPEILKTTEQFTSFYHEKHNGRKLTWLWQLCKGEMKANYMKNSKVPYTFQVSTFQMGILLLFNDADKLDYTEIEKATMLSSDILDPNLGILVKARVLIPSPDNASPGTDTSYRLNYDFKAKKLKINLNIQVKSETKHESDDTHKTVQEDRKLLLQSAIVRIMKLRKRMKYTQLVKEVIDQVKARFPPNVQDIKKNIDALMEKEYLKRLETDSDEVAYVA